MISMNGSCFFAVCLFRHWTGYTVPGSIPKIPYVSRLLCAPKPVTDGKDIYGREMPGQDGLTPGTVQTAENAICGMSL